MRQVPVPDHYSYLSLSCTNDNLVKILRYRWALGFIYWEGRGMEFEVKRLSKEKEQKMTVLLRERECFSELNNVLRILGVWKEG